MEKINFDTEIIKTAAPKAWADFELFYKNEFPTQANSPEFTTKNLPFELILGVFYRYFIENGVEWDISNTPYELLPETLFEVFSNYEKVISHYS